MTFKLSQGAQPISANKASFRVWAPKADQVEVKILNSAGPELFPLMKQTQGYFEGTAPKDLGPTDYFYVIDGVKERPDPASQWQPQGVHSPSRIVDHSRFDWADQNWKGIDLKEYIIYELHVGTFTPEGTFSSASKKIPYLKKLGITAVELMPVAQFPGDRNWGYDGAYPYAVQNTYGGPEGLKNFVNACHEAEVAVVLDVVYNHLGPEGNYLGDFGYYFTDRYKTPWGEAVNYDGPHSDEVRRYFIGNALYWFSEYHVDALRLDAIHAIFDFGAKHFLQDLQEQCHQLAAKVGKKAWIIAESDLNDVRTINPRSLGGHGIDAQWNDDFHHSLHQLLTGKKNGYFRDFSGFRDLSKAIQEGFVIDGRWSPFRQKTHGSSSISRPGEQFIICNENHDQIANACRGNRLAELLPFEQVKLAASVLLFSPNLPLIFMGQEWNETVPFLYFTSHQDPELAEAIREGYAKECASYGFEGNAINPQDEGVFLASKLDWKKIQNPPHREMLAFYQDAILIRKKYPCLSNCRKDLSEVRYSEAGGWFCLLRKDPSGEKALLFGNFSADPQPMPMGEFKNEWKLILDSSDRKYGGPESGAGSPSEAPPWSARLYV